MFSQKFKETQFTAKTGKEMITIDFDQKMIRKIKENKEDLKAKKLGRKGIY